MTTENVLQYTLIRELYLFKKKQFTYEVVVERLWVSNDSKLTGRGLHALPKALRGTAMYDTCSKLKIRHQYNDIDFVLLSLLLTLNRFHM